MIRILDTLMGSITGGCSALWQHPARIAELAVGIMLGIALCPVPLFDAPTRWHALLLAAVFFSPVVLGWFLSVLRPHEQH